MRNLVPTAFCLAALAGTASAQEAMSTAGASGSPPAAEVARQIDAWIAASPAAEENLSVPGRIPRPRDGRVHGQVELGIGTGGYRSGAITAIAPIGDSGSLMLHFSQSKNDYRHWLDGYDLNGRRLAPMR